MSDESVYSDPAVRAVIREHVEADENETIKIVVTSKFNISFKIELDTGFTRREWRELSTERQDEICAETVFEQEAISIAVLGDD